MRAQGFVERKEWLGGADDKALMQLRRGLGVQRVDRKTRRQHRMTEQQAEPTQRMAEMVTGVMAQGLRGAGMIGRGGCHIGHVHAGHARHLTMIDSGCRVLRTKDGKLITDAEAYAYAYA